MRRNRIRFTFQNLNDRSFKGKFDTSTSVRSHVYVLVVICGDNTNGFILFFIGLNIT